MAETDAVTHAGFDAHPVWLRLLPAACLAAAGFLLIALLASHRLGRIAALVGTYLVTPLGQEAWLVAARSLAGLSTIEAALILFWVSAVQALVFGLGVHTEHLVERIPRLGHRVRRFNHRVRARPRAQRNLGLALFVGVLLPIHSGGAILASIGGRVLGLSGLQTVTAVLGAIAIRFAVAVALVEAGYALFG